MSRAALLLVACLSPIAALHLESPPLLLDNAPLVVAWDGSPASFQAVLVDENGQTIGTPRLPAAGKLWRHGPLPPGTWRVSAVLRDPAGEVTERADWQVTSWRVPPPPAGLSSRWPRLGAGPLRLLVGAEASFRSTRPGLPGLLAIALERWLGAEVKLAEPPPSPERERQRLADWLTSTAGDLLLLDLTPWCAGLPATVAAGRAALMVDAARARGLEVIAIAPLPAAGAAGLRHGLLTGIELDARLAERALCLNAPLALLPQPFTDLNDAAARVGGRLEPDGAPTHAGHLRLMQELCRLLDDKPPVTVQAFQDAESLRLRVANLTDQEVEADVHLLEPAGRDREQGFAVALPARGARELRRELAGGQVGSLVAGAVVVQPGGLVLPLRVAVTPAMLGVEAVGGRSLTALPAIPARLRSGSPDPLAGVAGAGAGQPRVPFRLPAGGEALLSLPAPLPGRGRGRLRVELSAEAEGASARNQTTVRYAYANSAAPGAAVIDGRLGEWRDAAWQAIGLTDQVVEGAACWSGEADASLRWAARYGDAGLDLAFLVSDDDPTPADRLTVLLDPRLEELGAPGEVARRDLPVSGAAPPHGCLLAGSPAGPQRLLELRLPWSLVGRKADAGELMGWELELLDDGPDGATRLTYTGEDWGRLEPARLGLLRFGPGEPIARLLIEP